MLREQRQTDQPTHLPTKPHIESCARNYNEKRRKKEEVEVSSLNKISSESRPLQQQTTDQLNFILTNRPHPLVSSGLVEHFLDAHFRRDWHFTLAQSKWFVSRNVDQHMEKAKSLPNSFA